MRKAQVDPDRTGGVTEDRGLAHCPRCGAVEPPSGFDRLDPGGAGGSMLRCLDCDATFAWRCRPDDPDCVHGPFTYEGETFTVYFEDSARRGR